jgi:nucleoid DNA-binding protein/nucleoid-associated protein YgaU
MNKEKISSQEIIDLVASKASVSKRAAEEFLKVMIATVEDGLLAGEIVKIKNFGTFKLQWNEPRKSVNIQTGTEILIAGYYKVVFIPDATLKKQVNEPFEHLEPVELDSVPQKTELVEEEDSLDPLRIFTEQATEIKNLLSEIQAISPNSIPDVTENHQPSETLKEEETIQKIQPADIEPVEESKHEIQPSETKQEVETIPEIQPADIEPVEESKHEVQPSDIKQENETEHEDLPLDNKQNEEPVKEIQQSNKIQEEEKFPENTENKQAQSERQSVENLTKNEDVTSNEPPISQKTQDKKIEKEIETSSDSSEYKGSQQFTDLPVTPYLENVEKSKRSKIRIWLLLVLVVVSGLVTGIYFYYSPSSEISKITENISITEMVNTISNWFSPKPKPMPVAVKVVIPKEKNEYDSISQQQPVDSIQLLFDNPRVYNDFIASEKIKSGSRLTIMSKRYFGNKDFWVYIYEANKDRISNPDRIAIGTLIRIPKLDPRLIDATNPRCIEKAKQLHDIYVK